MEYIQEAIRMMEQLDSVLKGKQEQIRCVVITLLAKGHLLLEDVPGVGKTTLATALAKSIDCSFGRIQFTPDTLPGDVTGTSVYQMNTGSFHYIKGPIMNQILLADEINRTSAKTQASLLEAMEERQVTVDGQTYYLEEPFMVIATQNPIEFLGTYNLPEAQLDRFLMKITIGYPSMEEEAFMVRDYLSGVKGQELNSVTNANKVVLMQKEAEQIFIHPDLIQYIVSIADATRRNEHLALGTSPRATLALIKASQANAYIKDRTYVTPDDIQELIHPVMCHRMVLSMEAKMKRMSPEEIMNDITRKIAVPILRDF